MKSSPYSFTELRKQCATIGKVHHHGIGLVTLIATLFVLSLMLGIHPQVQPKVFIAGEVADSTIIASRSFIVEDTLASKMRRDQLAQVQPSVFDLSIETVLNLREQIMLLLQALNESDTETAAMASSIESIMNMPVRPETLDLWQRPEVQKVILDFALPWVERRLASGVIGNVREALPSQGDIIVRDLERKTETLRPAGSKILDISALLTNLSQVLRADTKLQRASRRSVTSLFSLLMFPTLTLNRQATLKLGEEAANTVEPVYYHVQKGEVLVTQGERVTRTIQLKLQSLFARREGSIQVGMVVGTFLMTLIFLPSLYIAPSGNIGTALRKKDCFFIALLLFVFTVGAKASVLLGERLLDQQDLLMFSYIFPASGAAGLCALIFAARRYAAMGLFLALFLTLTFKAGVPYFLFVFISCMFNTWLVIRAQTRQDVVWSFVPLTLGLCILASACGWLEGLTSLDAFFTLWIFVVCNTLLSVFLLFALSPVLEMAFGYTTRFRLMELLSLEQPLLQDLMVTIPGTYHHSLVVANMVEAGAKAVGANSMLCKVSALYHDVGKLAYPDYFIENQYGGENKHDKLSPTMSALILSAHVKKGCELAAEHRLGEEIVDIIRQHHGTSLIRYFYSKAKELGENPSEEAYMYTGPRPQTREAAIVMLADVVEASSRTLVDPTPARIKTHVDTILKSIFSDGQLDESDLRFKDLYKLSENFSRILTGIFHQRIAYPDVRKMQEKEALEKASEKASQGEEASPEKLANA